MLLQIGFYFKSRFTNVSDFNFAPTECHHKISNSILLINSYQCGPFQCRGLFRGVAPPALLCHKKPARCITKSPFLGAFFLLLAGSLWHKDSWLPCMERIYYRSLKIQRKARNAPSRGFRCLELVLYGIRVLVEQFFGSNIERRRLSAIQY